MGSPVSSLARAQTRQHSALPENSVCACGKQSRRQGSAGLGCKHDFLGFARLGDTKPRNALDAHMPTYAGVRHGCLGCAYSTTLQTHSSRSCRVALAWRWLSHDRAPNQCSMWWHAILPPPHLTLPRRWASKRVAHLPRWQWIAGSQLIIKILHQPRHAKCALPDTQGSKAGAKQGARVALEVCCGLAFVTMPRSIVGVACAVACVLLMSSASLVSGEGGSFAATACPPNSFTRVRSPSYHLAEALVHVLHERC